MLALLALLLPGAPFGVAAPRPAAAQERGPAVDRVVVPPGRLPSAFPPGAELRSMPAAEFDALLDAARRGAVAERPEPRLLRAEHLARWEDGRLVGRSELVVERPDGVAGRLVVLEPWSPAIRPTPDGTAASTADGRTALSVPRSGRTTATVSWELAARAGTDGRFFALALPSCTASTLVLDLPRDLEPAVDLSRRSEPRPTAEAGRRRWTLPGGLAGPGGLVLRPRTPAGEPTTTTTTAAGPAGCWVGGATAITVDDEAGRWVATWEVERGAPLPDALEVELDPTLEVVAVEGPDVIGFAVAPAARPVLRVRLRPGTSGVTAVTLRAACRVPDEGTWVVPAARPLRAYWTGGRTVVTLRGSSRRLETARTLAGQPVPLRGEAPAAEPTLAYDLPTPESPAELVFRRAEPEALAEVRGSLQLGPEAPRLSGRITWTPLDGRLMTLAADVPGPWTIERVTLVGQLEEPAWQLEPRPGGGTRLAVAPSPGLAADAPITVQFEARAPALSAAEGLALPRVAPVGARLADDVWSARAPEGYALRPIEASGLVWIDAGPPDAATEATPAGPALGWRWNAPTGAARLDVARVATGPSGTVRQVVIVDPDRVRVEGQLAIDLRAEPRRTLRVVESGPGRAVPSWRWLEPAAGAVPAREVTPADAADADGAGPRRVWELDLGRPRQGRIRLAWRSDQPLGERTIPVFGLMPADLMRGTVLVAVDRSLRSTVRAEGLLAFSPDLASAEPRAAEPAGAEDVPRGARLAHALAFGPEPGPRVLELLAERLAPAGAIGVIRDAVLEETRGNVATRQQRVTLRVAMTAAGPLDVTLPPDAQLQRVLVDGRALAPTRDGLALTIPLPGPGASRPLANVVLEYGRSADLAPTTAPVDDRPAWPAFSLPCLAYTWQLDPGADRVPVGPARGGVLATIDHEPTLLERLLGPHAGTAARPWPWPFRGVGTDRKAPAAGLVPRATTGVALGDLATRWEADGGAILVDRLALQAAGLGPWSRLPGTGAGTDDSGPDGLARHGLRVEALGGARVLTTTAAATFAADVTPADRARVAREAIAWGVDRTGRYATSRRWRVEPAVAERDAAAMGPGASRASWVVGPGTEVPRFALDATSRWRAPGLRAAILLVGLALGVASRRAPAARRGLLLAGLALGVAVALSTGADAVASGGTLAAVATLSYWIGRGLRRPGPGPGPRAAGRPAGTGSTTLRPDPISAGTGLAVLLVLGPLLARGQLSPPVTLPPPALPAPPAAPRAAILVVQVDGEPGRVWLARADADRLEELAARGRAAPDVADAAALAVAHRLSPLGASRLALRSTWTLLVRGAGPAEWTVPAAALTDLRATLDGEPVPLELDARAGLARVRLEGTPDGGRRVLVLEAQTIATPGASRWAEVPLRASALAEVVWEGRLPGAGDVTVRLPNARGEVTRTAGGLRGRIGPVDRLVVERPDGVVAGAGVTGATGPRLTSAEGLLLWDALPAGDRIRARFTVRGLAGERALRVRLGPGVDVRAAILPGMEYATVTPEADGGVGAVWTGLVDASLGPETTLALDLWRPGAGGAPRVVPLVQVLGVAAEAHTMGVRRPAGWSGRLEATAGAEAVADEVFARLWGPFPEPAATLAGAIRFAATPASTLRTAPVPPRAVVEPTVRVQVEPGRLRVRAEGRIRPLEGQTREVLVGVPPEWAALRVEAGGLTAWSRPAPDVLRLRFDRPERGDRLVRLEGLLPVYQDPLDAAATTHRVPVPWPVWTGLESAAGTLILDASEGLPITFEPAAEVRAQALKPPDLLPRPAAGATPYRVEPAEISPGTLSWSDPPPRPRVAATGALTLYQNAAELAAVLHYNLPAGPLEGLAISLPTAWAEHARLEAPGVAEPFVRETRGALTVWTLTPARPLWGTQVVRVRATRPYDRSQRLEFPELLPRGRGEVRFALVLLDASGQSPVIAGSGVADVEAATVPLAGLDVLPGVERRAFRIVRDRWSLAVQGLSLSPTARGETPVALASVQVTTGPDGVAVGVGRYELGPQVGPFLAFRQPSELDVLGATVDGVPVRPLREPGGGCLVPLGPGTPGSVRLAWRQRAPGAGLAIPQPTSRRGPTLLRVRGPSGRVVEATASVSPRPGRASTGAGWQPSPVAADLDLLEVEATAALLSGRVRSLDRSSATERAGLLAALVRFELDARAAERAQVAAGRAPGSPRVRAARDAVAAALGAGGLDDFAAAARVRLGAPGADPLPELPSYPEPVATLAAPAIGAVAAFTATGRADPGPEALAWRASPPPSGPDGPGRTLVILCAGLCVAAAALAGSWLAEAVPAAVRLVLLASLAVGLAALQPWAGALAAAAGLAGRAHRG
jgi:hypothetical protein